MQPPTVRQVISRLRKEGWKQGRTNGDHRQFVKGGRVVTIAGHMGEHLDRGTYRGICRSVGW